MSLQPIIRVFLLNNFSRIINLLLTKLARDRPGRISAVGLFCTDVGPILSQYGTRAWLILKIYLHPNISIFEKNGQIPRDGET